MSYFKKRKHAIKFALSGLVLAFQKEVHLKLFAYIGVTVCVLGFYFGLTKLEWIFILSAISFVICLELFNSAIEKLCDVIKPEQDPSIKYIKDVLAASVLISSIYAAIVGVIIFFPYVKAMI